MTRTPGTLLLLLTLPLLLADPARAQVPSQKQASKETEIKGLRLVDAKLGIAIGYVESDTRPGGGKYLCGGMSKATAISAAKVVSNALGRIPKTSLDRVRLKYVIVCSRALASGQSIGGIPVPPLNLLMLNMGDREHGEHLVLHELYHLVEYRFGSFSDTEWDRRFGGGYANSYASGSKVSAIGSGKPGFLNSYSETFAHEERAELFAHLVLERRSVHAHLRSTADGLLKKKILHLIEKCNRMLGPTISTTGF